MSEEIRKWRCPYCDGLNDWQDEICQICGDGHRPEAEESANTEDISAGTAPSAVHEEAAEPEKTRPAYEGERRDETPATSAPPVPHKNNKGILVAVLLVVAALAGGGLYNYNKSNEPAPLEIKDNNNGTVSVKMINGSDYEGWNVAAVYLGDDPDAENLIDYFGRERSNYTPLSYTIGNGEQSEPLGIIPGGYTRFILEPYDKSYRSVSRWELEPVYYPERTEKLPLTIRNVKICRWEDYNAMTEDQDKLFEADYHDQELPDLTLEEVPLTSAEELNACISNGKPNDIQAWAELGFLIETETDFNDLDEYFEWKESPAHTDKTAVTLLLRGPGFWETYYDKFENSFIQYLRNGNGIGVINGGLLDSLYPRLREVNGTGYVPGDYALEFYIRGVKVYTLPFTLS